MSKSLNSVNLLGHIGRDAELTTVGNGIPKITFSMATTRSWKEKGSDEWKEETDWHRVVFWRNEKIKPYLTKGAKVHVSGRLQTRSFDGKDGGKVWMTEVIADDIILCGGAVGQGESAKRPTTVQDGDGMITDDDVPF